MIAALFAARLERLRRDRCHRSQMVFGRISRRDYSPDKKDINEYFLSQKKSSELKYVLKVAVTFYYKLTVFRMFDLPILIYFCSLLVT